MKNPFEIESFAGQWFVQNPDRGETLADDSRLIVGGNYFIQLDKSVKIRLQLRDRTGSVEERMLSGRVTSADAFVLTLELQGDVHEKFEFVDACTLRRISSNIGTTESSFSLVLQNKYVTASVASGLSSIIFNTMPKSGSVYISRWLSMGLGLTETKVAVCLFPDDLVIREKYDRFVSGGGMICQQHLPARDINLRFIANRDPRIVVHLRDPRQATVSWTHHLDNFYKHRDFVQACKLGLEAVTPHLPSDYFERSFEARLDYQIHTHFPQLIEWTRGWTVAASTKAYGLKILFTTFEEFKQAPEKMVADILRHYCIESSRFDWSKRPQMNLETHFRKGEVNEWRQLFSTEQIKYVGSLLSADIAAKFGWQT